MTYKFKTFQGLFFKTIQEFIQFLKLNDFSRLDLKSRPAQEPWSCTLCFNRRWQNGAVCSQETAQTWQMQC